jgi:hypothetical protein
MSQESGVAFMIFKYTRQSKNGPQNSAREALRRTGNPIVLTSQGDATALSVLSADSAVWIKHLRNVPPTGSSAVSYAIFRI